MVHRCTHHGHANTAVTMWSAMHPAIMSTHQARLPRKRAFTSFGDTRAVRGSVAEKGSSSIVRSMSAASRVGIGTTELLMRIFLAQRLRGLQREPALSPARPTDPES